MTQLGELYKATRRHRKKRVFSRLRHDAAALDILAEPRLRWHVQRWMKKGWRLSTIAKRMGMEVADVRWLAGIDKTPRLFRGERG